MNDEPLVHLHPIDDAGRVDGLRREPPPAAREAVEATVALYRRVGFRPPWIGYLATTDGGVVGTCGFAAPPHQGDVEIAYYTFPDHEGRGIATAMAAELIAIARRQSSPVRLIAHTLVERNASHRVLEKLGFTAAGPVEHPEDGTVLLWRLA